VRNWWCLPWWLISPLTGAKSFVDNPVIGSARLNRLGLHATRIRAAHALARLRRKKLSDRLPRELRKQFEENGFIIVPNFVDPAAFESLRDELLGLDMPARSQQQGDTVTTRVPVGPRLLAAVPNLDRLLRSSSWQNILHYVASFGSRPLYYLQAIRTGFADEAPDPQQELHCDTFHPSMKAWLFLNDVRQEDAPLTYVAGSHRLTPARIAWERAKSIDILVSGDRLSQRGSLRIAHGELKKLGLPEPTRFTVPANTLVVIDTCGFHARGRAERPTVRTEIWAYCRRSPFIPWTGLDPLSLPAIADRRGEWLAGALDRLDRKGWARQHWKPDGVWRDHTTQPAFERPDKPLDTSHACGRIPRSETV
jgi:hypothetical protein